MIEVSHLTKRYGDHVAVEDLTFTVEKGAVYGFLGPNGAGKTTTMNILAGCLAATEGQVAIGGHDIFEEPLQARRLVGYLPEQPPLYLGMTPREYLAFVARAKGVAMKDLDRELEKTMAVTGVTEVGDRLIRNLSKGFRQRVGILSEVQAVCDRILMIHRGKLVACGTPAELEGQLAGRVVYRIGAKASPMEVKEALEPVPGVTDITAEAGTGGRTEAVVSCSDQGPDMDERLSFALSDRRIPVLRLEREQTSLEDVFLALAQDEPAPAEQPAEKPRRRRKRKEADGR